MNPFKEKLNKKANILIDIVNNNINHNSSQSNLATAVVNSDNNIYIVDHQHQQQIPIINNQNPNNEINNCLLPSNIHDLNWKNAVHIEKTQLYSKNSAILVTFKVDNNQLSDSINNNNNNNNTHQYYKVVVKSSPSIAQEVYVSVLESIMKFPIPEMRLLEFSNPEFKSMSKSLQKLSLSDPTINHFIKKELKKSFFLVMEYSPGGKTLEELNFKEYFSGATGEKKFVQLGQIIAFDMFCNNWDRFPLIWDSEGNFSNILFFDQPNKDGWYFSLIDSNISCISNSSFTVGYHRYINRLKSLLYSLFSNPCIESHQVKKLRELISKTFKIHLSETSGILLQRGIILGIQQIVNKLSFGILKETKEKVKSMIKYDYENIWKKSIDGIYLPFLNDILDRFDEFEVSQKS
eukprot:gene8004-9849_t